MKTILTRSRSEECLVLRKMISQSRSLRESSAVQNTNLFPTLVITQDTQHVFCSKVFRHIYHKSVPDYRAEIFPTCMWLHLCQWDIIYLLFVVHSWALVLATADILAYLCWNETCCCCAATEPSDHLHDLSVQVGRTGIKQSRKQNRRNSQRWHVYRSQRPRNV